MSISGQQKFIQELSEQKRYQTSPDHPGVWIDRLLGWMDFWCHLRQFLAVASGSVAVRFGRFGKPGWTSRAYRIMRIIEGCGGRLTVEGVEHVVGLPGPAVFVANHMSSMETLLLPGLFVLPIRDVTTVVKESLTRVAIFGAIMRDIGCIAVGRENPREDLKLVLEKGCEYLARGCSVMLFPQSTRSPEFRPAEFNSLGVKLAKRAGVPVMPVALRTDFQGQGRILRDFGPVDRSRPIHFKFGPPIAVQGNGRDAHRQVVDFIVTNLKEWGAKVDASAPVPEAGES